LYANDFENAESKADITTIYRHIPTIFSDVSLPHPIAPQLRLLRSYVA